MFIVLGNASENYHQVLAQQIALISWKRQEMSCCSAKTLAISWDQ